MSEWCHRCNGVGTIGVGHSCQSPCPVCQDTPRATAPEITEANHTDMICEGHPWLEWPHDDCAGPGCPPSAAMTLMRQRERSLQIGLQLRDTIIVDLRERVLALEAR